MLWGPAKLPPSQKSPHFAGRMNTLILNCHFKKWVLLWTILLPRTRNNSKQQKIFSIYSCRLLKIVNNKLKNQCKKQTLHTRTHARTHKEQSLLYLSSFSSKAFFSKSIYCCQQQPEGGKHIFPYPCWDWISILHCSTMPLSPGGKPLGPWKKMWSQCES